MKRLLVIKALQKQGYYLLREGGKHSVYTADNPKPNQQKRITVPRHPDISEGTARAILKQAGE